MVILITNATVVSYFGNDVASNTAVVGDYTSSTPHFHFSITCVLRRTTRRRIRRYGPWTVMEGGSVVRVGEIHGVILVQKRSTLHGWEGKQVFYFYF